MHPVFSRALIVVALAGVATQVYAQPRTAASEWSPVDNTRVHVWADRGQTPATGQWPTVRISLTGDVRFTARGVAPERTGASPTGGFVVLIELKAPAGAPNGNASGFPLAFPRPNVTKVLENDLVVIWDYTWTPGVPTPMHVHDKDVVVLYLEDGALRSTEPNGQSVVNPHTFGFAKFNSGNRVHTEELIGGKARAIITELK